MGHQGCLWVMCVVLCCLCWLLLGTYCASFDIISYVCINARQVNCLCNFQFYFFDALVFSCRSAMVLSCSSGGMQTQLLFTSRPSSMES